MTADGVDATSYRSHTTASSGSRSRSVHVFNEVLDECVVPLEQLTKWVSFISLSYIYIFIYIYLSLSSPRLLHRSARNPFVIFGRVPLDTGTAVPLFATADRVDIVIKNNNSRLRSAAAKIFQSDFSRKNCQEKSMYRDLWEIVSQTF